jgi:hypothetical protein
MKPNEDWRRSFQGLAAGVKKPAQAARCSQGGFEKSALKKEKRT